MQQENFGRRNWHISTIFIFGILILLRFTLSSRLPSYLLPGWPHDDGWVFNHALFVMNGEWFGPYDEFALIKGVFSPLFLAFSALAGISFAELNTSLYCFACIIFVSSVRPMIKNHWLQILLFAWLLFNPITYALHTGQRIYRIGMGQWEIMLIIGCLIAVFLRSSESWKSLLKWELLCGLTLGVFLQTREDGVWMYPLIFGSIISAIIVFLIKKEGPKKKIVLFLLPVFIAIFLNLLTAIVNYSYYGELIVNDRNGGNFAKVAGDLYLIKPNADEDKFYKSEPYDKQYYTIYVSTMEKAFAVSPTLQSAAQPIRDAIRNWATLEDLKSGQLGTDHMLFALRDGVKMAGYYKSLPETEAFFDSVHKELQKAFTNGTIEKRGFPISPLIMPLQKSDFRKIVSLMPRAILEIIEFKGISSAAILSTGDEVAIKKMSLISGGDYFVSSGSLIGSGWAFAKDDKTRLIAGFYDKSGALISNISFHAGEDVFKYMQSTGFEYQNARMSRFLFRIDGYDLKSGLTFRFFDQYGNLFKEIPADGNSTCGDEALFYYCIDALKEEKFVEKFYTRIVNRANHVGSMYQMFVPFVTMLACLGYFVATISLTREILKKQVLKTLPAWLIMTGLASTFILFMFCMCLITATSFNALDYWYTAPAYLLILIFCGISVCWGVEATFKWMKYRSP